MCAVIAWPSNISASAMAAAAGAIRARALFRQALVSDRLQELADPEAAGVAGRAVGRQDAVGPDRLVAVVARRGARARGDRREDAGGGLTADTV
jgi:CubicO group peptidase (beta-lactamase class C family)